MIYVKDVERGLRFYRDLLGFKLIEDFRYEGTPVYARMRAPGGGGTIALHQAGPEDSTKLPRLMPWGWRHAYLNDPDGLGVSRKTFLSCASVLLLFSFTALAQNGVVGGLAPGVVGSLGAVTFPYNFSGVPYSATRENESIQTLGDGTHIARKTHTGFWRDSQGRTRTEMFAPDGPGASENVVRSEGPRVYKPAYLGRKSQFPPALLCRLF